MTPILRRAAVLVWLCLASSTALAQGATETIKGRVTSDSSHAVAGATVFVTRGPDRLLKQTTTDSAGRYAVTFENGTGDYLVAVSGVGLKSARRRVQRAGTETELTADFVLAHDQSTLAAVKVTAQKPERADNSVSPFSGEPGASEKWKDGVDGQVNPSMAGDLNAIAGTMPGMVVGPNGISMLGAGSESNLTTLNGLSMPGASVPRASRVQTRVTGASFDATRGGFSGANIDVQFAPGNRNYQSRNAYVTWDARSLQFTDPVGRSLGVPQSNVRASVGADGELIRRALTYNVGLDYGRVANDAATLLDARPDALASSGVAEDSVARALGVARTLGLPLSRGGIPLDRQTETVTWLGRIDDSRDSLNVRALTTMFTQGRNGGLNFGALSAPSAGGEQRSHGFAVQGNADTYFGPGRRILSASKIGFNRQLSTGTPYFALPGASVLVRSTGADGEGISAVSLGGNSSLANSTERSTWEGSSQLVWNARGRKHTFKAFAWARTDALDASGGANLAGRYAFNSIDDFAAGRASSYTRTLTQPERSGSVWNGAAAFTHSFRPSRYLSLMYGARAEANGFGTAPARNAALESALGVASGAAPTLVHVSPRFGFSYMFNRDKQNGNGMANSPVGTFFRNPLGVISGGIGEFRDLLRPDLVADARAHTGLGGSSSTLSCVGAAVPVPDWADLMANPASAPTECAGGGGVLAESAPGVSLIDPSYDVPRSWRASLGWDSNFGPWMVKLNGLASYDLNQAGTVDANFSGVPRFALADEGGRPVFVTPASIDPASAAVSSAEARRSADYGRVGVRTSDLRGYGGQLTLTVAPDVFKMRRRWGGMYGSLSYTLQQARRQYRGFDGAAFGDPRTREWAPNASDARHVVLLQGGFSTKYTGALTFFARAQSGLPFTPIVQGDVNGDGRSGDRAYVPDAATTPDAALAQQLRALAVNGTPSARECIAQYAGRVADRNGCRGPWTATMNMLWKPRFPDKIFKKFEMSIYLDNVLGGVDQALHGKALRGWGSTPMPDPVLLVPRGFNAATRTFAYDVNPRFAETRASRTNVRSPFRITLDFHAKLSTEYELQRLRRAMEPVKRRTGWERRSADSLAAFYLTQTSDIFRALLAESDSLFLRNEQIAGLRKADAVYMERVRGVYVPLGKYLAQFADGEAPPAALDTVRAVQKRYWKVFWEQPEIADSLITPSQRSLMPTLEGMLRTSKKGREQSQWQFGYEVPLVDPKPAAARP
ncbi:MAG: carboxypeptidase-like regulatory domain-containing protein [Gemmatimonadaceae bacterium]